MDEVERGGKRTNIRAFWEKQLEMALKGDSAASRLIADRVAPIKLVLEGSEDGAPLVRIFTSSAKVIEGEVVKEKARE